LIEELPVKLDFLMEYSVDLKQPIPTTGVGPFGLRGLATVTSGTFEGPKLKGSISAGGDWWLLGQDGVVRLDCRVTFETDDGAVIYAQYYGIWKEAADSPIPQPEEASEYGASYVMTTPRFETGDDQYQWLNDLVCVGEGKRTASGVAYRIYSVVND
jgi:hypothetical protein